jgi:hypothetical protein
MKRQIASVIGVLGLLLVAACANAQTNVTAKVPFDFVVGKATLPASDYSIQGMSGNAHLLVIRNQKASGGMIVLSNSAQSAGASTDTRLVFHRYGDSYFLAQIWTAGDSSGQQLKVSPREQEMARNNRNSEDVIVLASLR